MDYDLSICLVGIENGSTTMAASIVPRGAYGSPISFGDPVLRVRDRRFIPVIPVLYFTNFRSVHSIIRRFCTLIYLDGATIVSEVSIVVNMGRLSDVNYLVHTVSAG
jgi:hypothetical protein